MTRPEFDAWLAEVREVALVARDAEPGSAEHATLYAQLERLLDGKPDGARSLVAAYLDADAEHGARLERQLRCVADSFKRQGLEP